MTREEIATLNPNAILWDGLDGAIIGLAKRDSFGPVTFYDITGEIEIKLDMGFYEQFEEGDDLYDAWSRPSFEGVVVYDTGILLKILSKDMEVDESDSIQDMSEEQLKYLMALEYFDYNIGGAFVGEYTPIHLIIENEEEQY
jgi:hypothetical protein